MKIHLKCIATNWTHQRYTFEAAVSPARLLASKCASRVREEPPTSIVAQLAFQAGRYIAQMTLVMQPGAVICHTHGVPADWCNEAR